MKKTILLIAVFCAAAATQAQTQVIGYTSDGGAQIFAPSNIARKVLDTATLEVSYRMEWLQNPDAQKPAADLMLLQTGPRLSKYFSLKTWQTDSLIRCTPPEQIMANLGNFRGGTGLVVFQNYPEGELTCTDKISKDYLSYTESLPVFDWTLAADTCCIIGYPCRKATCSFRGRNYEAWYTEELPLSIGPWKFRGLPGLILAVKDDTEVIRLEATGIRQAETPVTMDERNYLKTSRKKFLSTEMKFRTDPIGYMSANSNIKIKVTSPDGTPMDGAGLLKKFNPLELE